MLGSFQTSQLRIEIDASQQAISESLLHPMQVAKWQQGGKFHSGMPEELYSGFEFTTRMGPLSIHHQVDIASPNSLRLLLSQGIDGFHEWYWGEGWVQSRLEGISLLPLSLGQTVNLFSLRQYLKSKQS